MASESSGLNLGSEPSEAVKRFQELQDAKLKVHERPDSLDPWIHRSQRMKCATCMWFVSKPNQYSMPALGRCRRHAPTISGYPVVFVSDWCGDHKLDEQKVNE